MKNGNLAGDILAEGFVLSRKSIKRLPVEGYMKDIQLLRLLKNIRDAILKKGICWRPINVSAVTERLGSLITTIFAVIMIISVMAATGDYSLANASERQEILPANDSLSKEAKDLAVKHIKDKATVCNGIYYLKMKNKNGIEVHRYGNTISVDQHEAAFKDRSKAIDWSAPFEVNSPLEKSYYVKAKWKAPKGWQEPEMPLLFSVIKKGGKWMVEGSFEKASCAEIASFR